MLKCKECRQEIEDDKWFYSAIYPCCQKCSEMTYDLEEDDDDDYDDDWNWDDDEWVI